MLPRNTQYISASSFGKPWAATTTAYLDKYNRQPIIVLYVTCSTEIKIELVIDNESRDLQLYIAFLF